MRTLQTALATSFALLAPAVLAADLPKPIQDMDCLVGHWKGTAMMTMGPDKAELKVDIKCDRISGGYGIRCDTTMTGAPGIGTIKETDLFGYEANTNKYHWYSVTNLGETHDHVAEPPSGDTIHWVFDGVQEGKPFKEVIDMSFGKDSKTMDAKTEVFVGGGSVATINFALKK